MRFSRLSAASALAAAMIVAAPAAMADPTSVRRPDPAPIGPLPANPTPADLIGTYRVAAGPDSLIVLELRPNGRFGFGVAAGSLGLQAEGRWTLEGQMVTLNTDPHPRPPEFTVGPVTRTAAAPLRVIVRGPNGRGIASISLRVGLADGTVVSGYTQEEGWTPSAEDRAKVVNAVWVEVMLPDYGAAPRRVAVDRNVGNVISFTLVPNDFGIHDFRDERMQVTPEGLRSVNDLTLGTSSLFVLRTREVSQAPQP